MSAVLQLTRQQVLDLNPCSPNKIPYFRGRKSLTAAQALEAGSSIPDLLWVANKIGRKDLCVKFALACAHRVSHLNTDARVKSALKAVQTWLDYPNEITTIAAFAAYITTYARVYATPTDANVRNAAAYAAACAASTASAASAGYTATCAATCAAKAAPDPVREREEQKRIFLEIFSEPT